MALFVVLGSVLTWLGVYWVSQSVFYRTSAKHRALPLLDQVEWNNRVAGSVHAVVSLFLAVKALSSWPHDRPKVSTAMTEDSAVCLAVILGYYAMDVILVLLNFDKMKRARLTLIHHVVTVFPFLVVSAYQQLHFWAVICALTEASTPFANFHWFLSKRGLRRSVFFKLNLISMLVTYFTFRVAAMPYFFVDFVLNFTEVYAETETIVWFTAGFGAFLISLMSFSWFMSLLVTAQEVFFGGDRKGEKKNR